MDRTDYIQTEDGDLLIQDGDLVVGDATQQHVADILDAEVGDHIEYITLAAAPRKHINSPNLNTFLLNARRALEADNFKVKRIRQDSGGEIIVDAR